MQAGAGSAGSSDDLRKRAQAAALLYYKICLKRCQNWAFLLFRKSRVEVLFGSSEGGSF